MRASCPRISPSTVIYFAQENESSVQCRVPPGIARALIALLFLLCPKGIDCVYIVSVFVVCLEDGWISHNQQRPSVCQQCLAVTPSVAEVSRILPNPGCFCLPDIQRECLLHYYDIDIVPLSSSVCVKYYPLS